MAMTAEKPTAQRSHLRGLGRLTIDGIVGVTHLVEAMHHTVISVPWIFGTSTTGRTRGITGLVYRSIRGVTGLVGGGLDAALAHLVPMLGEPSSSPGREAVLAVLNGVLGDHLADSHNPLAIPMHLRQDGRVLELDRDALAAAYPQPSARLLVFVHGLCMNDRQWARPASGPAAKAVGDANGESPATRLARDLCCTPLYLHYNSGRHISTNGREFAELLAALVGNWPVPVRELAIVGHSMGGLVARSACIHGERAGHDWLRVLSALCFLGTPHHGAPLERGGNWVDIVLGVSPYSAPFARLGKIRSAGITDLRYGNLVDDDWEGRDRFTRSGDRRRPAALPRGVACHAIAATTGQAAGDAPSRLPGDGLVPVDSALGRHRDSVRCLPFSPSSQWIGYGMNHLDLLREPAVFEQLRRWLTTPAPDRAAAALK
jgi:hypothetical protein